MFFSKKLIYDLVHNFYWRLTVPTQLCAWGCGYFLILRDVTKHQSYLLSLFSIKGSNHLLDVVIYSQCPSRSPCSSESYLLVCKAFCDTWEMIKDISTDLVQVSYDYYHAFDLLKKIKHHMACQKRLKVTLFIVKKATFLFLYS